MCVSCAKKKKLNQEAFERVKLGEARRRKVKRAVDRGQLTEDQAQIILQPLMSADEDYIFLADQALIIAQERFDRLTGGKPESD